MTRFRILPHLFAGLAAVKAAAVVYPAREYLKPFWGWDTMYNESVLMVSDSGKPAEASLLFTPIAIQSVKNSGLGTTYRTGVDWIYANGKLKLLQGSQAPFLIRDSLYPTAATPGWTMPKVGGGNILFQEGHYFHDRQLAVTYTHAPNVWKGPIPIFAAARLPNTLGKLARGDSLKIVLLGNSITAGYNASGFTGASPNMPAYGGLWVENLKANYLSVITLKNVAVAGKDAAWGTANVHALVTLERPDLSVISFGMNDGSSNVPADTFLARIRAIMADVKAGNPSVEFILVAPITANPESFFAGLQSSYLPKLRTLVGVGTELVDMTGVHQELLKYKAYRDMTGNNINHPNDFLHRWYAQEMSGLLINSAAVSITKPGLPGRKIAVSAGMRGLEIFDIQGRKIFERKRSPEGDTRWVSVR